MKEKVVQVKTKRMVLQPMSDEEIQRMIETSEDVELCQAYGEMLAGCRADPQNRIWYAPWKMAAKSDGVYLGDLGFKGPAQNHAVEIGYGILPEYEGQGYTTEAVQAMIQWAFGQEDVIFVEAESAPDNGASQHILEKCGFVPDGTGEEGPRFVLENPLPNWKTIYMLFGISIGTALGSSFGTVGVGLSLGLCLGLCIGAALDASAKKERDKVIKKREEHRQGNR